MKQNRKRFWMCYVDGGDPPTHKHWSEKDARKEAERLAKLTGCDVFVLDASQFVRHTPPTPPPVIEWKTTVIDFGRCW